MQRIIAVIAALMGFTGVAMGAFGSHGLRELVSPDMLEVWKTGVSYQLFHTPVILILALLPQLPSLRSGQIAAWAFILGVLLFSGSLYLLVVLNIHYLGMVTPVGGSLLLVGWLALLIALWRLVDKRGV